MPGFTQTSFADIPARTYDDTDADWLPVRHTLGLTAFGANAWRARNEGDQLIEPHDEPGEPGVEEVYIVIAGRAAFTVDGKLLELGAGSLVRVDPGTHRQARALERGTIVLGLGAPLGEAFAPSKWEAHELERHAVRV